MLPTDPPFIPHVKTLETNRLSIRIDTEEGYTNMFSTCTDEQLKSHFGILTDKDLQTQKNKVSGWLSTYRTSVLFFHLIERDLNQVIGSFAFHNWYPIHRRSEIGYAISADEHKNKGYMKEAVRPIIEFGFKSMNLNRIEAYIHPENAASRKLVEGIGFRQEGLLREHYCHEGVTGDSEVYGLLYHDCAGLSEVNA